MTSTERPMPSGSASRENPFAVRKRAAKVKAILAHVAHGETAADIARIADQLEAFSRKEQIAFAIGAGVNEPSETAWALVVSTARARLTTGEVFALAGGTR